MEGYLGEPKTSRTFTLATELQINPLLKCGEISFFGGCYWWKTDRHFYIAGGAYTTLQSPDFPWQHVQSHRHLGYKT